MRGPRDNYEDIRKRINYNYKRIDYDFIYKIALLSNIHLLTSASSRMSIVDLSAAEFTDRTIH